MKKFVRRICAALSMAALASGAHSAALVHDYELNGTLSDALGGPSLVAINAGGSDGTIGAAGFTFPRNSGLQLTNGSFDPANYSIEMAFSFDETTGWRRIIDFKDRATDRGLYDYYGGIQFYPYTTGSSIFSPHGMVDIIITRDSVSKMFNIYANGVNVLTLNDTADDAVFSTPNHTVNFFRDDIPVPNEASSGYADFIRFYDGVLSSNEASCLQTGTPEACGVSSGGGGTVPEPGSLALAGLALAGLGLARRSRR